VADPDFFFCCTNCGKPHTFWQGSVDPKLLEQEKQELSDQNIELENFCGSLLNRLEETEARADPFSSCGESIANWIDLVLEENGSIPHWM
jgi:hypothetical protein